MASMENIRSLENMLNDIGSVTGERGTMQRGSRQMPPRPPPPPYYSQRTMASAPVNYMYQDSRMLYNQPRFIPDFGYPNMNLPNMMTSQRFRNTLPVHSPPYGINPVPLPRYGSDLLHPLHSYSTNLPSIFCNTDMDMPSRQYYMALYEQLVLSNPDYGKVPFCDFYQGCIARHAERQKKRIHELQLQRQEVCQTKTHPTPSSERTLLGSWYRTPDVISCQVDQSRQTGGADTSKTPPIENSIFQNMNNHITSSLEKVSTSSTLSSNLPNTPEEEGVNPRVNSIMCENTNIRGMDNVSGPTVQSNADKELVPNVISDSAEVMDRIITSDEIDKDKNSFSVISESEHNQDLQETPLDMSVPKDTTAQQRKMWCLSNSSKKPSSKNSPLKLRFQFRTPKHDEKQPKGDLNVKRKKKKKHSKLSPSFKDKIKANLDKGDSTSSQSLPEARHSENNDRMKEHENCNRNQQEIGLQADVTEDLNKQSERVTTEGMIEGDITEAQIMQSTVDDNNNTDSNDSKITKDDQSMKDVRSDVIDFESVNSQCTQLQNQEGNDSMVGSSMDVDEQQSGKDDNIGTTQMEDRECRATNDTPGNNTDEDMTESCSDEEEDQSLKCTGEDRTVQGKKRKRRRSMQSMPSLFYANFHSKKLLCLNTGAAQFFIMPELLVNCFSVQKIPHRNGIQAFSRVLISKSRDLNIPFVELTVYRKQVEHYLQAKNLLRDGKHIGIIQISDAHRLYQFFNGIFHCSDDCMIPCEEVTFNRMGLIEHNTELDTEFLFENKIPSNSPISKRVRQDEVMESENVMDNEIPERIVRGGVAPLWNRLFRFIIVDGEKYFLHTDLKDFFGEEDVKRCLKEISDKSSKVKSLHCLPEEALFINKLEPDMPTVEEGSTVLEEKIIFALYDLEKECAEKTENDEVQVTDSTNIEAQPSSISQTECLEGSTENKLGSTDILESNEDRINSDPNISNMDTSEKTCTDVVHHGDTTENLETHMVQSVPHTSRKDAESCHEDATNLKSSSHDQDCAENLGTGHQDCAPSLKPVQQDCAQNLKPVNQDCEQGLKPVYQDCEQGLKPVNQDCEQGLKPVNQDCAQNLKPVNQDCAPSQNPLNEDCAQGLKPVLQDCAKCPKPVEEENNLGTRALAICGTVKYQEMEIPASKMKDTLVNMIDSVLSKRTTPSFKTPSDSLMNLICCCQDTCKLYHTKMHTAFLKMVEENNFIKQEMTTLRKNLKDYREGTRLLSSECQKFKDNVKAFRNLQDKVTPKILHST